MKITIEPTGNEVNEGLTVSVSTAHDDLTIWEVRDMIKGLLMGYGFQPESVDDAFGNDDDA